MSEKRCEYFIHLWERLKVLLYTQFLSGCFFAIGEGTRIIPPFRFHNLSKMQLGKKVIIHRDCWIHVLSGEYGGELPNLVIGDFTGIGMSATISVAKKVVIEDHVLLARNVYISDHGHKFIDTIIPISEQGISNVSEVRIGANSWLGQNSVVLPGVIIGRNCVIGANSVVNESVPDYSMAVGVPAKIVKVFNHKSGVWERVGLDE